MLVGVENFNLKYFGGEAIQVTIVGTIQARRTDLIDVDGRKARMFGHLGIYPGRIAVGVVRDVSVIDAADFASNMDPRRHF